jgi:hypothetical protein
MNMKLTVKGNGGPKMQILSQIKMGQPLSQPKSKPLVSMMNLGRVPGMQFGRSSISLDCGCAGGRH